MKLEARIEDRTFDLEILKQHDRDSGEHYRLTIGRGPDSSQTVTIHVLARSENRWTLEIDNVVHDVLVEGRNGEFLIDWNGEFCVVEASDMRARYLRHSSSKISSDSGTVVAQIPGKVVRILKRKGDSVQAGEGLAIIEAMKMQNEVKSPRSGCIRVCKLEENQTVEAGALLYEIE